MATGSTVAQAADPVVSIVIVSWRSADVLVDCLRSLHDNPPSLRWEVVIIDNASGDGIEQALTTQPAPYRLIVNTDNRGLPAANNQGFVATTGQFIIVSNPDVLFTAGAIDVMVAMFTKHSGAAFVVPRLRQADGSLQASVGDAPTLGEALFGSTRRGSKRSTSYWWTDWEHDTERQIDHGAEACYAVRRDALAHFGGQDERYPLDWEGVEWSARANESGWQVWFTPDCEIVHIGGVSVRQAQLRWVVLSHLGMYRYFSRRRGRATKLVLSAVILARALVKLTLIAARVPMYDRAHRSGRTEDSTVQS